MFEISRGAANVSESRENEHIPNSIQALDSESVVIFAVVDECGHFAGYELRDRFGNFVTVTQALHSRLTYQLTGSGIEGSELYFVDAVSFYVRKAARWLERRFQEHRALYDASSPLYSVFCVTGWDASIPAHLEINIEAAQLNGSEMAVRVENEKVTQVIIRISEQLRIMISSIEDGRYYQYQIPSRGIDHTVSISGHVEEFRAFFEEVTELLHI